MTRRSFRAMGTEIELFVDGADTESALDAAESEFHRLEGLLSRFQGNSELSRLNASGSIDASPDLIRVVELAVAAREQTQGRFDPTIHDALVSAGYDRSFELFAPDEQSDVDDGVHLHLHRRTPSQLHGGVHVRGSRIDLDAGLHLDLGGIGKGYAAERAAELLATAGPCLVNAGGDVATRSGSWPVGVETSGELLTLELEGSRALATSGKDRRRWRRNGREQHHLIDPRTGAPADSDLLRVTVVAGDAVAAEVDAKALFLAGADRAAAEADAAGIPAILVTCDARTILAGGLG
jgi:thiamine biosynthesis lipoprotein